MQAYDLVQGAHVSLISLPFLSGLRKVKSHLLHFPCWREIQFCCQYPWAFLLTYLRHNIFLQISIAFLAWFVSFTWWFHRFPAYLSAYSSLLKIFLLVDTLSESSDVTILQTCLVCHQMYNIFLTCSFIILLYWSYIDSSVRLLINSVIFLGKVYVTSCKCL